MRSFKELPESELIRLCKANDTLAQNELYRRFAGTMIGVCLRYAHNRDDAKDIIQDGFIKVFLNLHSFKAEGSFEGWIKRIMINTALKHYHKNLKFRDESDIESATQIGCESNIISNLSAAELIGYIQLLPDGYRTIFNLYAIEGYQHNEISEMLGISEGTSKSQLSRARNYLIGIIKRKNNINI